MSDNDIKQIADETTTQSGSNPSFGNAPVAPTGAARIIRNPKVIIAAVIGVVFLFAGFNLVNYFSGEARREAEAERIAQEKVQRAEQEAAERYAERQREQELAEQQARLREQELELERQRLALEQQQAEERRRQEALAAQEAERQRQEQARSQVIERHLARLRTPGRIEGGMFYDDLFEGVNSMDASEIQAVSPTDYMRADQVNREAIMMAAGTDRFMAALMALTDTNLIDVFLDEGFDINRANSRGFTPLMFAAAYNRVRPNKST